jgi:mono/diheme cytochrome c family protein
MKNHHIPVNGPYLKFWVLYRKMIRIFSMFALLMICMMALSYCGAEDFISEFEYGQMLYQNPRGVSCVPCHGDTGEGKTIAVYRDRDGSEKRLFGADIRQSDIERYRESIRKGPGVMPRYFLTDREIEAIYRYIRKVNDGSESDIDSGEILPEEL